MADTHEPLSIRQLEVFLALVENRSFTRAARQLSLSQSTVSGHVADLEKRVGVRLLDRRRGGVRPTAAGAALVGPARETLRAERHARMAIAEVNGLLAGVLIVGASTIPASYLLPGLLGRFHAQYPSIRLQIVTGDSQDVLARVREGDVEVGVIGARPAGDGLRTTRVGEDSLILVAPPDHPLAKKRGVTLSDVVEMPLVLRERGSGTRDAVMRALAKPLGKRGIEGLSVVCEVGSTEALKAAVRSGLGVTFVSNLSVREELEAGTLVEIPLREVTLRRAFHLVTREEPVVSPAARAFVRLATRAS
jgi:DNA-binding transcriptional LysR family regulator